MKHHTKNRIVITMLLAAMLIPTLTCCSDEDTRQPSYITCLVEANTDAAGMVNNIRTDDGTIYNISQRIDTEKADTTFRCLATYTDSPSGIQLYSLRTIFSAHPKPTGEFKSHPTDPLKLTSTWRTDRYINLRVDIMTTGQGTHSFGFCEDSITSNNGITTAHITLLHKRPEGDAESYTQETFLSMPLSHYAACDSFAINIPTYDGMKTLKK